MSTLEQIRDSIEARLAELRTEMSALQSAQAVLNGGGASAATTTGDDEAAGSAPAPDTQSSTKSAGARRRPRARRRTKSANEVLTAGGLEAMLGDAPEGLNAVAIADRSGAGYNQVLGLLRELEGAGRLRRSGTRRTTRWRLITDEERIAERAAELERRMRNAAPSDSG